jgi:hypothetical protein
LRTVFPDRKRDFLIIFAGPDPQDARARQVGFMSTQKRENRWQRMSCRERAGVGSFPLPTQFARHVCAIAKVGTAPLLSIFWSAYAWLATKFLQMDYLIRQLVRPVSVARHRGSQPPGVVRRAAVGIQASPRSSLPHISLLSGFAHFRRSLPQVPAGNHRRAERYDGKRDLYFKHAA